MLKRLSVLCLLILAACTAKSKEEPSYLYVITSKHGEIKKSSDGGWELTLDHGDIERVLAFSNRPYRIVKHLNAEELKRVWKEGANSLEKDPPNATVIINQHLQTVELLSISVEGSKTLFKIRADGPQSLNEARGPTQLFVDSWCSTVGWGCTPGW